MGNASPSVFLDRHTASNRPINNHKTMGPFVVLCVFPLNRGPTLWLSADTPSSEICSPPKRSLPLQHKPKSLETNSTPGGALRQFFKVSVLQKRTPLLVVSSVNSLKFQSCKFTWLSSGCRLTRRDHRGQTFPFLRTARKDPFSCFSIKLL